MGRRGPIPEIVRCQSTREEDAFIAAQIADEASRGRPLSDMAVLVRSAGQTQALTKSLSSLGIAFKLAKGQDDKRQLFDGAPSVKIVTLHSSKGLEFGVTFIPRLCQLGLKAESVQDDARLVYVGMTRATHRLVLTHVEEGPLCQQTASAIQSTTASLNNAPL